MNDKKQHPIRKLEESLGRDPGIITTALVDNNVLLKEYGHSNRFYNLDPNTGKKTPVSYTLVEEMLNNYFMDLSSEKSDESVDLVSKESEEPSYSTKEQNISTILKDKVKQVVETSNSQLESAENDYNLLDERNKELEDVLEAQTADYMEVLTSVHQEYAVKIADLEDKLRIRGYDAGLLLIQNVELVLENEKLSKVKFLKLEQKYFELKEVLEAQTADYMDVLTSVHQEYAVKIADLEEQIVHLEDSIGTSKENYAELNESAIKALDKEQIYFQEKLEVYERQIEGLQKENHYLVKERNGIVERLKKQLETSKLEVDHLSSRNNELVSENKKLSNPDYSKLAQELDDLIDEKLVDYVPKNRKF